MLDEAGKDLDPQQEETLKHFAKIVEAAKALGWDLAIPEGEFITGAIVGSGEYVDQILASVPVEYIKESAVKIKEGIDKLGDGRITITELSMLVDEVLGEQANG